MLERLLKEFDVLTKKGEQLADEIDEFYEALLYNTKSDKVKSDKTSDFPKLSNLYYQFEFRDMFIYPIEVLGNLGERDTIEIIRISPKDAVDIRSDTKNKLAGDALGHYGGFLKEEWRANDILWGRLDAAELIVRTLCKKAGATNKMKQEMMRSVHEEILNDELPDALESRKGYKSYLQEDHKVGEESLGDVEPSKRWTIGLSVLQSLKDMLNHVKHSEQKVSTTVKIPNNVLLKFLDWLLIPATLLIKSLFTRDPIIKHAFGLLIIALGAWGIITIAIWAIGKILGIEWISIGPLVVVIAAAAVALFFIYLRLYAYFRMKLKSSKRINRKEA
jgi:hypothetical protein